MQNQCEFKRSFGGWNEETQEPYIVEIWQCSRSGEYDFKEFYDGQTHHFKLCKQHLKIANENKSNRVHNT